MTLANLQTYQKKIQAFTTHLSAIYSCEGIYFDENYSMETLPVSESMPKKTSSLDTKINTFDQQLSFDDFFQTQDDRNHSVKLAQIPYVDYKLINPKKFSFPQKRFFVLSVVTHIMILVYAITLAVEKMQKPEIIEVSYVSNSALPPSSPGYTSAEEPMPTSPAPESKLDVLPTETTTKKRAKTPPPPIAKAKKSSGTLVAAEPLATVSDIAIPNLTEVSEEPAPHLSTKEFESDFDKIDDTDNEKIAAAVQNDAKLLEESISDLEQTSTAINNEESSFDNIAASRLEKLKNQKEQLRRQAQQAESTATATAGSSQGSSEAARNKSFGTGSDELTKSTSGSVPGGVGSDSEGVVRRLEDLRQKPGNPRPNYDVTDRMNGLSGTIIFNAYVTKEGNLTLFRLIQSTGHRNLDRKTLAALKNWRFYPGQEGWVELPFKWDLKGGVQQKPTLLKRR
ncbi:MAG: TonB family protein [Bdellovibrionaceae bacterium]|nr:TonB family protein [Pseudobdellovibrionaceae bacterium]